MRRINNKYVLNFHSSIYLYIKAFYFFCLLSGKGYKVSKTGLTGDTEPIV
jgi:hypothetical protein